MHRTFFLAALLLSSCATTETRDFDLSDESVAQEKAAQFQYAAEYWREADLRVWNILSPLLDANEELCGELLGKDIGIDVMSSGGLKRDRRDVFEEVLGLDSDERLTIWRVTPQSPAQLAGLAEGDVLLSVDGTVLPVGESGMRKFDQAYRDILSKDDLSPVAIRYERGGEQYSVDVTPVEKCVVRSTAVESDSVNAAADGRRIFVTYGMLRFVENDEELAIVLAHELAHNTMGHVDKKKQNARTGATIGILFDIAAVAAGVDTGGAFSRMGGSIASTRNSVEFEKEADYVGLYLAARAGHNSRAASGFWRRLAAISSDAIEFEGTHPTTVERYLILQDTATEIERKLDTGMPLIPEYAAKDPKSE